MFPDEYHIALQQVILQQYFATSWKFQNIGQPIAYSKAESSRLNLFLWKRDKVWPTSKLPQPLFIFLIKPISSSISLNWISAVVANNKNIWWWWYYPVPTKGWKKEKRGTTTKVLWDAHSRALLIFNQFLYTWSLQTTLFETSKSDIAWYVTLSLIKLHFGGFNPLSVAVAILQQDYPPNLNWCCFSMKVGIPHVIHHFVC